MGRSYDTFGGAGETRASDGADGDGTSAASGGGGSAPRRVNLYASPASSSALITAFGLPTLVECDPAAETAGESRTPEFQRVGGKTKTGSISRSRELGSHRLQTAGQGQGAYAYGVSANDQDDHHRLRMSDLMSEDTADITEGGGLLLTSSAAFGQKDATADVHPPSASLRSSVPADLLHGDGAVGEGGNAVTTTPPLKLWPLAVLVFYNVSGGPFGIEPAIRAGGNFYAILGFVVGPLVWSVPEALVTAELGSAVSLSLNFVKRVLFLRAVSDSSSI